MPKPHRIAIVVAIVCAASRWLAKARSLWDWDEALFTLGMRSFDVALHHPHPPGFPGYMALAKVARAFTSDDFHALQAVNLIAAMLLFPALLFLFREAGARDDISIVAAALCVFFPNEWFFGGTAFSDIPSVTLSAFGVALLFRGTRDRNAYWLGTLLLAMSMTIRPQNILIGAFAGICASRRRRWREIAVAAAIGVGVCAIAYGAAMQLTGVDRYLSAVRAHAAYIAKTDSFRSPLRPDLLTMFDRFFLRQYSAPALNVIVSLLVLIGIVGAVRARSRSTANVALTFAPFAIFAWLMIDRFSTTRYATAYAPLFALLAVEGMSFVARRWMPIAGAVLIAAFIGWCWPALRVVRTTDSPPVLAVQAAERMHPRPLCVATSMVPFVDALAPQLPYTQVRDQFSKPDGWMLAEIDRLTPRGKIFRRDPGRLWLIVRHRYFTVALQPK